VFTVNRAGVKDSVVHANIVLSSLILVTLMMEAIRSTEMFGSYKSHTP
jgi:hypothetical protein